MKIITMQRGETAEYAVSELKKYVRKMSRGKIIPEVYFVDILPVILEKDSIILGTLEELSLDVSDLKDPFLEDIIDIDIKNGSGYIAGSNPRSILMGIYRYCTSAGCRFIRPGENGDYVPHIDLYTHSYCYRKKADNLFRGECIEGATSYEHARDTVYWLPKIGMNLYMIEGLVPYSYMHRWYGHVGNTKLRQKGQVTDYSMLEEYIELLTQDIRRTGLLLRTLGHGWMFKKLGVKLGDPRTQAANLREEDKKYLALVNGKRDLYLGNQFYTHLCYSNPEVRKLLVDTMVEYIEEKPETFIPIAGLADAYNNQCECDECKKMIPSDHLVRLLNEMDEELTKKGLKNKIGFGLYVETERPPQKMRLNNPNRFIMSAAIGLHYEKGYVFEEYTGEIPEFQRNQYHPKPAALRFKWHREWKDLCGNIPSMIYEYRFYCDMYCDLGHMQIARETYRDMKALKEIRFNGVLSDQTHRMSMPTTLPRIFMGETLFDNSIDFEQRADEYFSGAFGEDGEKCREYLEKLSVLLCPSNFRVGGENGVEEAPLGDTETQKKCWINNKEVAEKAAQIPALLDEFLPVIRKNIGCATDPARMLSWSCLEHHSRICRLFVNILLAGAENQLDAAKEKYYILEEYLSEHEMEFHNEFDAYLFLRAMRMKLNMPQVPYYD